MSYTHLLYHIVFSTKDRHSTISPDWEPRLHEFLGGIIKDMKGQPVCINGMPDHVHMLCYLHQSTSISEAIKNLKARSSLWLNEENISTTHFNWQTKYGAFSVSQSSLEATAQYVRNQKEHHKTLTFKEEFLQLLKKHGLPYDERYIWE
jgi:putative transposase